MREHESGQPILQSLGVDRDSTRMERPCIHLSAIQQPMYRDGVSRHEYKSSVWYITRQKICRFPFNTSFPTLDLLALALLLVPTSEHTCHRLVSILS